MMRRPPVDMQQNRPIRCQNLMQLFEASGHETQVRVEIGPTVVVGKPLGSTLLDLIGREWRVGIDKIDGSRRKTVQYLAAVRLQQSPWHFVVA